MNVGLFFKTNDRNSSFLCEIIKPMAERDYVWYVAVSEGIKTGGGDPSEVLASGKYSHEQLEAELGGNFFFVVLEMFAATEASQQAEVSSFAEFWKSDYETAVFVVDTDYYSVFSKHEGILDCIKKSAIKKGCKRFEFLTEETADKYFCI